MKKALVLLLALCAVSAFAQDAAYDIEAEASVTWGYNLNDDSQGFVNDMSFELTFPLIAGASAATEGEGVYGELSITGLNLALYNDGDEGKVFDNYDEDGFYDEISAKIIAGAMYVTIWEAPGFELNNAQMQGPLSIDDWDDASVIADTAGATGGVTFGYKTEMFDVALQLASNGSYESATAAVAASTTYVDYIAPAGVTETVAAGLYFLGGVPVAAGANLVDGQLYQKVVTVAAVPAGANNVDGEYTAGLTLTLTPVEMLEVEFAAFADLYDGANKGLTLKATVTPVEGLELVASMDGSMVADADLIWDAAFEASYALANAFEVAFNAYYVGADSKGTVNDYVELGLTVTEDGEEGFVPALGAEVYFKAYDLMNSTDSTATEGLPAFVGASVDYTVTLEEGKTVKPYAAFDYGLLHLKSGADTNGLAFKVGVDIDVIANTTFNVEFAGGSVADDKTTLDSIANFGETGEKGLFTVSCTIAF